MLKPTKEQVQAKLVCATCGKPIAGKAQTNVTRFLSNESRCSCGSSGVELKETTDTAAAPPHALPLLGAANDAEAMPSGQSSTQPDTSLAEHSLTDKDQATIKNLPDYFEALSRLGEGGMGTVYKVRDKRLDKTFAVKVLHPTLVEDNNSLKRFEQEAQAASNLTHVNMCAVYAYGVGQAGAPYIVMDYLDGSDLGDVIANEGSLAVPRAVDIFVQVGDAIEHAHMKGVLHRDIKPSNIILEVKDDGTELAKLVDFGIAKVLPSENKTTQGLTQTGEIFGSPLYMSPEQCMGNKLDARSDIYEFGCVMYEALSGKPPFSGGNPIKTILKHINEDAPSFKDVCQDKEIPTDLEYICMRCLERDPANRYQSMRELLNDLLAFRDQRKIKRTTIAKSARELDHSERDLRQRAQSKLRPRLLALAIVMTVISAGLTAALTNLAPHDARHGQLGLGPTDPENDANRLDSLSYSYFAKGDYEKAIPLLEFGVKAYRDSHKMSTGAQDTYLADNLQHIGKCYAKLGNNEKAQDYYSQALTIYRKWGFYRGGGIWECVQDYIEVLKKLGRKVDAQKLQIELDANSSRR